MLLTFGKWIQQSCSILSRTSSAHAWIAVWFDLVFQETDNWEGQWGPNHPLRQRKIRATTVHIIVWTKQIMTLLIFGSSDNSEDTSNPTAPILKDLRNKLEVKIQFREIYAVITWAILETLCSCSLTNWNTRPLDTPRKNYTCYTSVYNM